MSYLRAKPFTKRKMHFLATTITRDIYPEELPKQVILMPDAKSLQMRDANPSRVMAFENTSCLTANPPPNPKLYQGILRAASIHPQNAPPGPSSSSQVTQPSTTYALQPFKRLSTIISLC